MDSSSFHRSFWPQITKQIGKIQSSKSGLECETIDVEMMTVS